jgi:formylglycine-generating enzyme required for sulfatase activity/serine/threonine protein kinase
MGGLIYVLYVLRLARSGSAGVLEATPGTVHGRRVLTGSRDQEAPRGWFSMPWPSTTEYNDAIQNLRTSVSDEELRAGELARTSLGLPLLWSGSFADVYRVHCAQTGNTWAVKCFTRQSPGLRDRYREIATHLEGVRLPFMVDFHYVEPGIRAGSRWCPFLKMRWVEGVNLNQFVGKHVTRPGTLKQLLGLWVKLAARLRQAQIAHADLQHGNVLLVPLPHGQLALRLIDYDGMYVPALAGRPPGEVGHPAYQHPLRLRQGIYGAEVDRFSHLAIYCAIRCLLLQLEALWDRFDNGDNLLFREVDFRNPGKSEVFHELWALGDPDAHALVGRLILATQTPLDRVPLLTEVVSNGSIRRLSQAEERQVRGLLDRGAPGIRVVRPFVPSERSPAFGTAQAMPPGGISPAGSAGGATEPTPWWVSGQPKARRRQPPPLPSSWPSLQPTAATSPQPGSPARARTRTSVVAGGFRQAMTAALERGKDLLRAAGNRSGLLAAVLLGSGVAAVVLLLGVIVARYFGTYPGPQESEVIPPKEDPGTPDREITVDLGGGVTMQLVRIPAGEFLMGSPDSDDDADGDEKPQHQVRITQPFYLGKYEVTQEQWEAVMGDNPSRFKAPKSPVEGVSWDDCQDFLSRLNQRHGKGAGRFILPTEAQWEYACRAGGSTRWCFGDDEASVGDYAWYEANSGETTHPVSGKRPNAWGLYDVHGNVWEWCADPYDHDYYKISPSSDPKGPDSGTVRVLRGGSWDNTPRLLSAAYRSRISQGGRVHILGLRVARTFRDRASAGPDPKAPEPPKPPPGQDPPPPGEPTVAKPKPKPKPSVPPLPPAKPTVAKPEPKPPAETEMDLRQYFDPEIVSAASLAAKIEEIPEEKKQALRRFVLKLELIDTTPWLYDLSPRNKAYAERVLQQIDRLKTDDDEFREVEEWLRSYLSNGPGDTSFSDAVSKWKSRTGLSHQGLSDQIVALGEEIVPLLVRLFLDLDAKTESDGYYLPGNIQVELCDPLGRLGGRLAAVTAFLHVGNRPNFDSTAMIVALATLRKLLPPRFEMEDAYKLSTGRSLASDEEKKKRDREAWNKRREEERKREKRKEPEDPFLMD